MSFKKLTTPLLAKQRNQIQRTVLLMIIIILFSPIWSLCSRFGAATEKDAG